MRYNRENAIIIYTKSFTVAMIRLYIINLIIHYETIYNSNKMNCIMSQKGLITTICL